MDQEAAASVMYVVLVGPFQGPPDLVVGPFDTHDDAVAYAISAPGDPDNRYAVVFEVSPP